MMNTLSRKLILAFLLVAVIAAVLVAVVIRYTSPDRLNTLLRAQEQRQLQTLLVDYYTSNGSFEGVVDTLEAGGYLPKFMQVVQPGQPPITRQTRIRLVFALADEKGRIILSVLPNYPPGHMLIESQLKEAIPLEVEGNRIGSLIIPQEKFTLAPEEQNFLDRTSQALWLAALGAVTVALITGILLARSLSRPLHSLTSAASRMAEGDLEQVVPVTSRDEIGQLTRAFNRMSQAVSKANQSRRQMTADIAHDLRTPLTVIGGYIESMQEGVLDPSPERLEIIHGEIERLQHMVEDLRTLSHADAGELTLVRRLIAPRSLLEKIASLFRLAFEKKGIALKIEAPEGLRDINIDEDRMLQVLTNLVDNALRHTPEGGTIILGASKGEDAIILSVQDTGEGIPSQDLPLIFERFYRADKARGEAGGASGLGLAIARALVMAHGGKIRAESTPGQGTTIEISIPPS